MTKSLSLIIKMLLREEAASHEDILKSNRHCVLRNKRMDISALGFGLRKVPGMLDQLRNSLH